MTFLNIKQVASHLGISEKTVYRLIKKNEIPAIRVGKQWRFNKLEVVNWLRRERPEAYVAEHYDEFASNNESQLLLYNLLKKDGICFGVPGKAKKEVLKNAINTIPIEAQINKKDLLTAIMDREKLCSTGIGHGTAFPHPRHPNKFSFTKSSIYLCFLDRKINYEAIDNIPVDKLFFIFAKDINEHLHILQALSRLFLERGFLDFIDSSRNQLGILNNIKRHEVSILHNPLSANGF